VIGSGGLLAPTLTTARLVPNARADIARANSDQGVCHGRTCIVDSKVPIPGTMATECRRVQRAIRHASTPTPNPTRSAGQASIDEPRAGTQAPPVPAQVDSGMP
jgi:hypothetical protein